ncbi:MAG TPA: tetratricopeptide repeat protein [Polyangiaceae bacterium]|nr:tetratricopeptide repeat protein [Polyangiaceae bacterium]
MDEHTKQALLLGREYYEKGELERADTQLRTVLEQGADRFADVYDMLGVIAHGRGALRDARQFFERAIALNPNYTEAQLNLMVTLNDLGEFDAARSLYAQLRQRGEQSHQLDPFARGKIANMHADTSQAYQDVGMMVEAIGELEKAVALCPNFADLRTRLGVLYRDTGDKARARQQFEAAKAANPKYLQARLMLGVLLLTSGEPQLAVVELEHVLESDPTSKSAEMYLRVARKAVEQAS